MRTNTFRTMMAACLTAAAMAAPQLCAWAAEAAVSWTIGAREDQAELSVRLPESQAAAGISALQVDMILEPVEGGKTVKAEFVFDSALRDDKTITIQDCVYDEEAGTMMLVAAGNDIGLFDGGRTRKLGILTAKGSDDIQVSVVEAWAVAGGEKIQIPVGGQESAACILKVGGEKPVEPEPDRRPSGGGGGGSSSRSTPGAVYAEPFATALETPGNWEWTGTVWRFKLRSGRYAKNTWIYVKGEWYHINQNTDMDLGWYQAPGGTWYYLTETGAMKKGWIDLNGIRYHLREDNGKMNTGWFFCDNNWFYANQSGTTLTGWQMINEKWYYLNPVKPVPVKVKNPETGQMEDSIAGQRLYGAMYAAEKTPDGFTVDDQGARQ